MGTLDLWCEHLCVSKILIGKNNNNNKKNFWRIIYNTHVYRYHRIDFETVQMSKGNKLNFKTVQGEWLDISKI